MKTVYFSQHGQDFIVDRILKNPNTIVEVGCIDGLRFSNSYFFEKNYNINCHLFEPHKEMAKLIPQNRPKSTFKEYAISNFDDNAGSFFQNYAGTFSNLSNEFESNYKNSAIWGGYKKVENVKIRRLDTCFKELNISEIDFLSIDIDGNDIYALEGINLHKIMPTVLCIEMNNSMTDFDLYYDYLKNNSKYRYFLVLKQDFFAFKNFKDYLKSIFNYKKVTLFHFKYPFGEYYNTDKYAKFKVNGFLMLHSYFLLKHFSYRRFFYRLQKLIKILFRKK